METSFFLLQTILHNYNQNKMILEQKQKFKTMEPNLNPRDKAI